MPSPIGHTLAGLALAGLLPPHARRRGGAVLLLAANLPDLDFLPGLWLGRPTRFHRGGSHSLGTVALAGAAGGLALRRRIGFGAGLAFAGAACASHLLLDLFSETSGPADGLPLLHPLSSRRFWSGAAWFRTIRSTRRGFVRGLLIRPNARAVLQEVRLLLPVAAATWAAGRVRG